MFSGHFQEFSMCLAVPTNISSTWGLWSYSWELGMEDTRDIWLKLAFKFPHGSPASQSTYRARCIISSSPHSRRKRNQSLMMRNDLSVHWITHRSQTIITLNAGDLHTQLRIACPVLGSRQWLNAKTLSWASCDIDTVAASSVTTCYWQSRKHNSILTFSGILGSSNCEGRWNVKCWKGIETD